MKSHTDPGFAKRFLSCLRFEFIKLCARALPWLGILAAVGATLSVPFFDSGPQDETKLAESAWAGMAEMVGRGLATSSFFLLILGATTVNAERQRSSLRAYFLRPVGRFEVLAAKAKLLGIYALILGGLVIGIAWLVTQIRFGFLPIEIKIEGLQAVPKFDVETISSLAMTLQGVGLLSLFVAPMLGLFISTVIDSEGTAVAVGAVSYGMMKILYETGEDNVLFRSFGAVARGEQYLRDFSRGIETNVKEVETIGLLSADVLMPLGLAYLLFGLSWLAFSKRELSC